MNFQDVEAARQHYRRKTKRAWLIAGAAILTILVIAIILQSSHSMMLSALLIFFPAFFALVISIIAISLVTRKEFDVYRKAYKAYFVEQNLRKAFSNLTYSHEKGLNRELIRATGMIYTGDRYSSNDLTIASYKNVNFLQADAHIEVKHTDSDGDTTYNTIFRGRIMIYEFPKKFNFKLEIIGKRFFAYRLPRGSADGRKMAKVSTESVEFNKNFKVYGEDGFEAFYILDPAFMVKIQNIAEHYKYNLLFGFLDNKLIIALNDGKDSFEPPKASRPIDEQAEMSKIGSDIKVITDFIDQLSLDRNLFK